MTFHISNRFSMRIDEAAKEIGIHPVTLYRAISRGTINLRVIRIGRRIIVPKSAVDEFLAGGAPATRKPGRPKKGSVVGG